MSSGTSWVELLLSLASLGVPLLVGLAIGLRVLAVGERSKLAPASQRAAAVLAVLALGLPLSLVVRVRIATGAWPARILAIDEAGALQYAGPSASDYPAHHAVAFTALLLGVLAVLTYGPVAACSARARALRVPSLAVVSACVATFVALRALDPHDSSRWFTAD